MTAGKNRGFNTFQLKMLAVLFMVLDHVYLYFFSPSLGTPLMLTCIGRLSYPLFLFCMVWVGLLVSTVETFQKDRKRGGIMLGAIFALISQPFYVLAFHPHNFWAEFTNWNIFFTLFLSLLAMYGLKERKWWLFALSFFVISWWNFDYSSTGIFLMLIFYLCRNRPIAGAVLYLLLMVPPVFHVHPGDPLNLTLGGFTLNWTFAVAFAPVFIFPGTHTGLKIPRWFFYAFYPAHLLVIAALRLALGV